MKRLNLLILIPCLLSTSTSIVQASNDEITLSNEVISTLSKSFESKFEIKTDIKFNYEMGISSLTIIDQFDERNRINVIKYDRTTLQEVYISSDELGYAVEQFLTVSNEIDNRYIIDTNGDNIKFTSLYSSPFTCFTSLTLDKINSYFEVIDNEETYLLKAKKKGYGVISNLLLSFYTDFDALVWDSSVNEYIEDYVLEISKEGIPLSYSFTKIKKDNYGGIKESYYSSLKIIDSVDVLTPFESSLTEERKEKFNTSMKNFQDLLDKGNFTQTITFASEAFVEPITYSNYFDLINDEDFIGSMICSYPLEETTKGETYVCLLNEGNNDSPSFASYGISPSTDYFASLTTNNYSSIEEVVPRFGDISADYFSYNSYNRTYKFNLSSFIHADSYFCGTLLASLFGISDPFIQYVGFYLDDYSYNFNSLTIGFDENGYPYGTLEYNSYSYVITSSFKFTNVGTTDITSCEDIFLPLDYIRNNIL